MENSIINKKHIFESTQLEDLSLVIDNLITHITKYPYIIHLHGVLGAGKTTLTSLFLSELGIEENITSPTFTYVKEYNIKELNIYHFDLYRISEKIQSAEKDKILEQVGYYDAINDKNGLVIIEWPSKAIEVLQKPNLDITIEMNEKRTFTLEYK